MTSIREYFDTDQKALNAETEWNLKSTDDDITINIKCKLSYKIEDKLKFFSLFFPKDSDLNAIKYILNTEEIKNGKIDEYEDIQEVRYIDCPESTKLSECTFVRNIFIYVDRVITEEEKNFLERYGNLIDFKITIRDQNYAKESMVLSKPLAFISHDSKDKDTLVRDLAKEMISLNCPVWYDEYTLEIGDNLREKIETGIKEAKYCIIILSENYVSNKRWAKSEFDSIFIKEIHEKEKGIILPIWHNINEKSIYEFSPSLLNIIGSNSSKDVKLLAKELVNKIKS